MRLNFSAPPKNKVIVFDGQSLVDLKYILENHRYFVIESRNHRIDHIYCGLTFLLYYLLNFFKLFFKNRNLKTVYFYTLIKIINPKIVITSIDNSYKFSDLAKLFNEKIKFVAIQNANRLDYARGDYLFKKKLIKKNLNKIYYKIPYFFCFGEREIDQINKYNIEIKNIKKIGSIRTANFFRFVESNKIKLNKNKYDICLISEPISKYDKIYKFNNDVEKEFAKIISRTIYYVKKKNLKFIFLQRRPINTEKFEDEMSVYKRNLKKEEINFLINHSSMKSKNEMVNYISYYYLFQSKLAIGYQSTLLSEKIGLSQKILSCNLFKVESFNKFPINGICQLPKSNYLDFEDRITKILSMKISEYLKELSRPTSYVMEFDKNESAIEKVEKELRKYL